MAAALVVDECPQDVNAAKNESNNENNSDLKKEKINIITKLISFQLGLCGKLKDLLCE